MIKNALSLFFICLHFVSLWGQSVDWRVEITLNDRLILPFFLESNDTGGKQVFHIVNGAEKIPLDFKKNQDSVRLDFQEMDSYLIFKYTDARNIRGYWQNNRKGSRFSLHGSKGNFKRFESSSGLSPKKIEESYEITFGNDQDNWPAIGLFNQKGDELSGTFLTETGDYRFLDGNVFGDQLYLSCFDGAHAFVFTAKIFGDSLSGRFYSGASYQTNWRGALNQEATIGDPNKLTYLSDTSYDLAAMKFKSLFMGNKKIKFKKHPLTVIQIMGSWCPNCLDETNYFKVLHQEYGDKGIQIIALGFESQKTKKGRKKHLKEFSKKAKIPYDVFLAGKASKKEASRKFSMLNGISSFPTTLFVDQRGEIIHIHTGFYGPGTGVYYERYKKETEGLIQSHIHTAQ